MDKGNGLHLFSYLSTSSCFDLIARFKSLSQENPESEIERFFKNLLYFKAFFSFTKTADFAYNNSLNSILIISSGINKCNKSSYINLHLNFAESFIKKFKQYLPCFFYLLLLLLFLWVGGRKKRNRQVDIFDKMEIRVTQFNL